jgi:hypothetical protein
VKLARLLALTALLLASLPLAASAQAATPSWRLTVTPSADYFLPGSPNTHYTIEAEDLAGPTSSEPLVIEDTPPAGLSADAVHLYASPTGFQEAGGGAADLSNSGLCPTNLRCEYSHPLQPGEKLVMQVRVQVPFAFPAGPIEDSASISGGGAPAAAASASNRVDPSPSYGFHSFEAPITDSSANPYTQAGGHPYQFTTEFNLDTDSPAHVSTSWGRTGTFPVHDPQNLIADLPPGLVINQQGVPHCELAKFLASECEISAVVGTIEFKSESHASTDLGLFAPVFNLQPAGPIVGELGYVVGNIPFFITAHLNGADYAITAGGHNLTPVGLSHVRLTLWGVPADHAHDAVRGKSCDPSFGRTLDPGFMFNPDSQTAQQLIELRCTREEPGVSPFPHGGEAGVPATPFITMPTACPRRPKQGGNPGEQEPVPLAFTAHSLPWGAPEEAIEATYETHDSEGHPVGVDGCNQLKFEPEFEARPTTTLADSPSGFDFDLRVPQNHEGPEGREDPNGRATAELREAVVEMPAGLTVNPSSAAGLGACTEAQVGILSPGEKEQPARCPDAAKLGTVEVHTQLLHEPLSGSVYLATPYHNPFGSLLAGYIVVEGQGLIVKLAGQFHTDPVTGQITASFLENPETPFEEFNFHFFGGARGSLRTPSVCGAYQTSSVLTPYSAPESGPPAEPATEFETTEGPQGGSCPNSPSEEPAAFLLHAGTESAQAGAYSPFALKLVRADGSQELARIETTLPPGLVGKLAGVGECSEAQLAQVASRSAPGEGILEREHPSCPAASEVGTVEVATGAGPTPIDVSGHAYLAGPYKGAPLSLAIVSPAIAGPFDLGTVLVRTALYVDPTTAQIRALSDTIPRILQGIPLDVRSVTLEMSRPDFTLNPTNCEPLSVLGNALTFLGVSAPLLSPEGRTPRFQVGGCNALPFKPSLSLSLRGNTKRAGAPALKAVLTMKPGEANIAKAQVTLPSTELVDNEHIGAVCTAKVFAEGNVPGEKCPPASVYGHAKAWSPLLDHPLEGPVFLKTPGHKLPDLLAALNGQIDVALEGKVDTGHRGGLRNTFEVVPDAPVSKFVLEMKGADKGLLQNNTNICARPERALADFTAQSGKVFEAEPVLHVKCPKRGHHRTHHHRAGQ